MHLYLGEIRTYSFSFAPPHFVPCDGRLLNVYEYELLYSLLETTFGGDGVETFGVPNIPPMSENGPYFYICWAGTFPFADR